MTAPVHYTVRLADPAAHLFEVTVTVQAPDPRGQVLALPVWIPGSYMVREFAKGFVTVEASSAEGAVRITQIDKRRWRAEPCEGPLSVTAVVYGWELTVRLSHLDTTHAFFNGTSLFLAAEGHEHGRHTVELVPPEHPALADWEVATAMRRVSGEPWGWGTFEAADYDELVDHPFELGSFERLSFEACGVPHDLVVTGRHRGDLERLVADLVPICEHHIRMFGEPAPMDRYVFLLTVTGKGYGGLEHRASSANICMRADLPRAGIDEVSDGYRQLLGLLSHEYFHTWNVKRIKPRAFVPYDLSQENYTRLLWAFEGFTSYYDDLGLLRTERIELDSWLELVGRTATRVLRGPGRLKQSVAESSFTAWTKFYRQDENAPNAIVSYYAKGALVALALDLKLRELTDDAVGLDTVMVQLWQRYGDGSGVPERGIHELVEELAGAEARAFLERVVAGTEDLPLAALLERVGLRWNTRPASSGTDKGGKPDSSKGLASPGDLGVKVSSVKGGAKLAQVFDGGAARAAGLSAGDVVVAFDGLRVTGSDLVEAASRLPAGTTVQVHAFRRDELHVVDVTLQEPPADTVWLEEDPEADEAVLERRRLWLSGAVRT